MIKESRTEIIASFKEDLNNLKPKIETLQFHFPLLEVSVITKQNDLDASKSKISSMSATIPMTFEDESKLTLK